MRTTLDLPDSVFRQLKAKAAIEGTTLKALLGTLIARGLQAPASEAAGRTTTQSLPPSIKLGRPLMLRKPSNAKLFELLDE
jgi:hypothetical protein